MKNQINRFITPMLGIGVIAATLTLTARGEDRRGPENCREGGSDLAVLQNAYIRWYLGELTIAPDANTNAAVGSIVLLPIPNTPGDGTAGHVDVTLNHRQSFTLPLLFLLGTSYTDGTPPDPFVSKDFFKTLQLTLKIDGVTVMNDRNKMEFFSKFYFQPPVPINSAPTDSVIWCEDIGYRHGPLSPGTHTIKLDVKSTQALPPNFGGGFLEFHNTWTVTVKPGH